MPRAEVGSTKYLNNKIKSKGLQRLRWFCQACQKQTRDENGFKCHTQSESHVRAMLLIGEDSRKYINDYSNQFQRDFLQLLRTSHGEKKINLNHFYQEYISNKEHIHMNSTRWPSLTELGKYLGREGICRVEEGDKGLEVAWIDNSPEALRRSNALRKKERQDRGDEEREQKLIKDQIEKARRDAEEKGTERNEEESMLVREEGEKIKLDLNFGGKKLAEQTTPVPAGEEESKDLPESSGKEEKEKEKGSPRLTPEATAAPPQPEKVSLKMSVTGKPKNVFAMALKKNAFGGTKPGLKEQPKRPMSEAERIMKEEIERKRSRGVNSFSGLGAKKQKVL